MYNLTGDNMSSVYIHIPFCASKCPYCDFYSFRTDKGTADRYVDAVLDEISTLRRSSQFVSGDFNAQTLYLGGGTPSVLGGEALYRIITAAKEKFGIPSDGEITVECNPASDIESIAPFLAAAGVNRVSLGLQSAVDGERRMLGRLSGRERVSEVLKILRGNGIENISLDVMLGIPMQTEASLDKTLDFVIGENAVHVSAYILKLEENTVFYKNREKYDFPDDDAAADLYEHCCERLENAGYEHYEISNFARSGFESRHNSAYWLLEDYLGIGAAAHSFVNGRRFYYTRSAADFIDGKPPVFDCAGGDAVEYIMLRLRLKNGLSVSETRRLYGESAVENIIKKAPFLNERGLVSFDGERLSLTTRGMLVSNAVIAEFIQNVSTV